MKPICRVNRGLSVYLLVDEGQVRDEDSQYCGWILLTQGPEDAELRRDDAVRVEVQRGVTQQGANAGGVDEPAGEDQLGGKLHAGQQAQVQLPAQPCRRILPALPET